MSDDFDTPRPEFSTIIRDALWTIVLGLVLYVVGFRLYWGFWPRWS